MIYQADFIAERAGLSGIYSEIAVKLHGAAMGLVKREYAELLHTKDYHPFSIFTVPAEECIIIRVSALNDEARCIIDAFRCAGALKIYGIDKPLDVVPQSEAPAINADRVWEHIGGRQCRLVFASPACFKSGGRVCCFPEPQRYFYSAICKYNKFEGGELVYDEFCTAFAAGEIGDYRLSREKYNVSGNMFHGMTGYIDYRFPADSVSAALLKRVFAYATYCGVGGKTGMGMGGFIIS